MTADALRGHKLPAGAGVTCSFELTNMGAGNGAAVVQGAAVLLTTGPLLQPSLSFLQHRHRHICRAKMALDSAELQWQLQGSGSFTTKLSSTQSRGHPGRVNINTFGHTFQSYVGFELRVLFGY